MILMQISTIFKRTWGAIQQHHWMMELTDLLSGLAKRERVALREMLVITMKKAGVFTVSSVFPGRKFCS